MISSGIPYFPLDVKLDSKFELIEAEFGLTGFGVVVKLFQEIYGQDGYYIEWTNEVALLFSKRIGLGGSVVSEIVSAAIRRGIFDRDLFEKYSVLTSKGIQQRYFEAVSRRKQIKVKDEYLLVKVAQICKNVDIQRENVSIFQKNENISEQRKEEKRKEEKSIEVDALRAFPDGLRETLEKWLRYKSERRESYPPTGLHSLLEQVQKYRQTATDEQICALIETCMANGWKGIAWDRLPGKERQPQNQSARTGGYHSLDARELDDLIKKAAM